MIQQALFIVEAQHKRTHHFASTSAFFPVTKASDHAIRRTHMFDFLHAVAIAGLIRKINAFGDDTVAPAPS